MFNKNRSIFFKEGQTGSDTPRVNTNKLLGADILSSWNWRIGLLLNYGVRLSFGKEDNEIELKYTCSLMRLDNDREGNLVFALDRTSDVYINEIVPDLIADKLAFEAGKVFYPLHLCVDPSGELCGVANAHAIQQRWPNVKEVLRNYFQGDFFEEYLEKMDKLMLNEHNIFSALRRTDWLLNVFFQPFYQQSDHEIRERMQFFPNLPTRAMVYHVIEKIVPELNHFGAIELMQQGALEQNDDFGMDCTGTSEALYIFHPRTRALLGINGKWTAKIERSQVPVGIKIFYLAEDGEDFLYDDAVDKNRANITDRTLSNNQETVNLSSAKEHENTWAKLFNL